MIAATFAHDFVTQVHSLLIQLGCGAAVILVGAFAYWLLQQKAGAR